MVWPAIAAAAAAAAGGYLQYSLGQQTNAANATEAQKNRDYQERMSSSAYQRSVADMKAAGLNPAMMYASSGGAASTPAGSQAKLDNPGAGLGAGFSSAASLALEALRVKNESQRVSNETKATDSNVALQSSQAAQSQSQTALNEAVAARTSGSQTQLDIASKRLAEAQASSASASAQQSLVNAELLRNQLSKSAIARDYYSSDLGKDLETLRLEGETIGQTGSLAIGSARTLGDFGRWIKSFFRNSPSKAAMGSGYSAAREKAALRSQPFWANP